MIWAKRMFFVLAAGMLMVAYFSNSESIIFTASNMPQEVIISFNKIFKIIILLVSLSSVFYISIRMDKRWNMIVSGFVAFLANIIFNDAEAATKERDKKNLERLDFAFRLAIAVAGFIMAWHIVKLIPIPTLRGYENLNSFIRVLIIGYFLPIVGSGISLVGLYLKEFLQGIPIST